MKSRLALRSNCVLLSNRLAGQLQIEMLERRTLLSAGALIDTFGTHGIATTFANSHLASSVAQPDGKIIAIDTIGIVRRFNTDGSLDQNFGNNGVAQISGFQQTIEFDDVALQKDGSIVIAGALNGKAAMYRFSSAGVVDATLNNGLGVQPGDMSGQATSVIVQGDGKILLGGAKFTPGDPVAFVLRVNVNGTLDDTFGNGGFGNVSGSVIGGLAFDSNNRIVVDAQINTGPIVMRLLPTGSSDYFGDNGNGAKLPFNNFGKPIVRPDDSILIPAIDGDGFTGNPSMTALTSTGQIDTSFGTNGIAKLVHSTNFAAGLYGTLQPDGKIDLATTGPVGGDDGIVIARFDSQGKLDSSFGSNGAATVSFANSVQVHSIIYTNSEPRITVVANSVGNIVLAAFDALTPVAPPPSGTISGTVFNDANGNNQRDGNEAGLAGRTVFVDANQNHTLDPGETSAVTDSTGHYSFGVLVGQYTVRDTQPAGWKSPLIVPQQVIVTQAQTTVVNLASSKTDTAMPLDTTFGTAGVVRVSQLGGEGGIMRQSDGKLLVIGSNTVGRFTAAGALDKTFGVNGWASNPFTNADVDSLALQSDGKIVVAGTRPLTPTSSSYGIVLGRLNSDGSPDKTYGTNGIVTTSLANVAAGVRVALRQDNSAIVTVFSFAPTPGFNLVLVKPTGQIDSTFGTGGYVVLNIDKTTIQTVCRLRPMQFFWLELWLTD